MLSLSGKESLWNLKRHLIRQHEEVMKQIESAEQRYLQTVILLSLLFITYNTRFQA